MLEIAARTVSKQCGLSLLFILLLPLYEYNNRESLNEPKVTNALVSR